MNPRKILLALTAFFSLMVGGYFYLAEPAKTPPSTNSVSEINFELPPGISANPDQMRQISSIKSKYLAELGTLADAKQRSLASGADRQAQNSFFKNEENKIRSEIAKALDAILTPEQRQQLRQK